MKPDTPADIGVVGERTDIPEVTLWLLPIEVETPPEPAPDAPANTRGIIYTPTARDGADGAQVAAQCDYCGCWYFWPVESADRIELLQCVSCYRLYRPLEG